MPSQYKYYELYSLGCFTARTESLAVSLGFTSLLLNTFLFLASLSSEPLWSIGPPALFHMFAAFTLFYAGWANQPSYCWVFLVVNGFTISALGLALFAALLLDLNPQLVNQFKNELAPRDDLRQMELGLLVLLLLQWMAQGLIWHYYRYLKHRKAEQFFDNRPPPSCQHRPRHGSFHISNLKRLQIGAKMSNGK